MTPELLLAELAHRLNAPTLQFNAQGCARLACGPGLHGLQVQFEQDPNLALLHAWCDIGPAPAEATASAWQALLQANLFGSQTGGAVLALDTAGQRILLCRSWAGEDTDAAAFVAALEGFLAAAARWHLQVQQPGFAQPDSAAPSAPAYENPAFGAFA